MKIGSSYLPHLTVAFKDDADSQQILQTFYKIHFR